MTARTRDNHICGKTEVFPSFISGAEIEMTRDILLPPSSFSLFVSYFLRIQALYQILRLQRCFRTCLQRTYSMDGKQIITGSGQRAWATLDSWTNPKEIKTSASWSAFTWADNRGRSWVAGVLLSSFSGSLVLGHFGVNPFLLHVRLIFP